MEINFSDNEKEYVLQTIENYKNQIAKIPDDLDKIESVYEALDIINNDNISSMINKPSCKKGCSHCCYIQVAATQIEIDYILNFLKDNDIQLTENQLDRLKEQSKINNNEDYILSVHRKCIFLSDKGDCSIYEARPLACRNYYVFNDPKLCNTFDTESKEKVAMHFDINTLPLIFSIMNISEKGFLPNLLLNSLKSQ